MATRSSSPWTRQCRLRLAGTFILRSYFCCSFVHAYMRDVQLSCDTQPACEALASAGPSKYVHIVHSSGRLLGQIPPHNNSYITSHVNITHEHIRAYNIQTYTHTHTHVHVYMHTYTQFFPRSHIHLTVCVVRYVMCSVPWCASNGTACRVISPFCTALLHTKSASGSTIHGKCSSLRRESKNRHSSNGAKLDNSY